MKISVPNTKETIQRLAAEQGLGSHKSFNFEGFVLFWIMEVMQQFRGTSILAPAAADALLGQGIRRTLNLRMMTTPAAIGGLSTG